MARQVRRASTYTLNPSISPTVAAMVETGFFASPSILSSSVHSVPVVGLQIMEVRIDSVISERTLFLFVSFIKMSSIKY